MYPQIITGVDLTKAVFVQMKDVPTDESKFDPN